MGSERRKKGGWRSTVSTDDLDCLGDPITCGPRRHVCQDDLAHVLSLCQAGRDALLQTSARRVLISHSLWLSFFSLSLSLSVFLSFFPFSFFGTGRVGAGGVAASRWRTARGRSGRRTGKDCI